MGLCSVSQYPYANCSQPLLVQSTRAAARGSAPAVSMASPGAKHVFAVGRCLKPSAQISIPVTSSTLGEVQLLLPSSLESSDSTVELQALGTTPNAINSDHFNPVLLLMPST